MEIQTCPTSDDTDASEASETKRTLEIDPRRCTTHQKTYTNALERAGRRSDRITRFQIDPERLQGERNGHVDETIASGGSNCPGTHRNEQEASRGVEGDRDRESDGDGVGHEMRRRETSQNDVRWAWLLRSPVSILSPSFYRQVYRLARL